MFKGNFEIVNSLMQQADLIADLHYRNIGGDAMVKEKQKLKNLLINLQ